MDSESDHYFTSQYLGSSLTQTESDGREWSANRIATSQNLSSSLTQIKCLVTSFTITFPPQSNDKLVINRLAELFIGVSVIILTYNIYWHT